MSALDIFRYGGTDVRVVLDDAGDPLFVASDVAAILGYRMASDLTRNLDDDERGTRPVRTPSGDQDVSVITEAGLFRAIVQRQTGRMADDVHKAFVKGFQRWLTHDVLPAIRKTDGKPPAGHATSSSRAGVTPKVSDASASGCAQSADHCTYGCICGDRNPGAARRGDGTAHNRGRSWTNRHPSFQRRNNMATAIEATQPHLSHYRAKPLELDRARTYTQREVSSFGKPVGFWLSVDGDDDWATWCTSEGFRENTLTFRHRVTLAAGANVKVLPTVDAMDEFEAMYLAPSVPGRATGRSYPGIDWARVAKLYDGILIPTYQWMRRDRDWYYGWDCASGCIWNLDAIESVTAVELVRS